MKILLDHCVPRPFAGELLAHEVRTTHEMGWQDESNGKLLGLAAAQFDAFLTVDKNMARQQNIGELPIPVVVLRTHSNSIKALAGHTQSLLSLLNQSLQRRVYVLELPEATTASQRHELEAVS